VHDGALIFFPTRSMWDDLSRRLCLVVTTWWFEACGEPYVYLPDSRILSFQFGGSDTTECFEAYAPPEGEHLVQVMKLMTSVRGTRVRSISCIALKVANTAAMVTLHTLAYIASAWECWQVFEDIKTVFLEPKVGYDALPKCPTKDDGGTMTS